MLKGIPTIISPELMKVMMEMGHGDEIVIADGNFPATSHGKRCIRSDGNDIPKILDAILKFMPIDTYIQNPITLMEVCEDDPVNPVIWKQYQEILGKYKYTGNLNKIDRFEFYNRAQKAYAIVATSEKAQYANIIISKGVVLL
ncbi:L-fucose mutarotase [Natronincola peptidivorans]|uniref:L-fucose mutarotase n=1 Tax=Natronincola peptidivorans TaxID=426128 RepID=A0A1I0E7C5_9FIRM|nr:RbsD/FucU domain-containing protein [Natronincola peptidivorans]SET40581.1 L-fucose mutarotase [Natronincola peptidivorans]